MGGERACKTTARLAGLAYLVVIVTGFFSFIYVPSLLIDTNAPVETAAKISASDYLFKLGIATGIVCHTFFLILPLLLYRLLKQFDAFWAGLMVLFATTSVPISFVNLSHQMAISSLIDRTGPVAADDTLVLAQVSQHLGSYESGLAVVAVFWGLWLFPLGCLVLKSRAIPRILGLFLILGSVGYLVEFFGGLLLEGYEDLGISTLVSIPSGVGEIGTCLWLLVMGARVRSDARASSTL